MISNTTTNKIKPRIPPLINSFCNKLLSPTIDESSSLNPIKPQSQSPPQQPFNQQYLQQIQQLQQNGQITIVPIDQFKQLKQLQQQQQLLNQHKFQMNQIPNIGITGLVSNSQYQPVPNININNINMPSFIPGLQPISSLQPIPVQQMKINDFKQLQCQYDQIKAERDSLEKRYNELSLKQKSNEMIIEELKILQNHKDKQKEELQENLSEQYDKHCMEMTSLNDINNQLSYRKLLHFKFYA